MLLAIIPARSGSKGIPDKNIKLFCGKPLMHWTIKAALNANGIDRVIVSTDDKRYATIAESSGAEVPFIRPKDLAQDNSSSISTILHALKKLPQADEVLLLQPTSPLRNSKDIELFISFWRSKPNKAAISISETKFHPSLIFDLKKDSTIKSLSNEVKVSRRQDLPKVFSINGALYIANRDFLFKEKSFLSKNTLGFIMPQERSIDIDNELDWLYAEYIMNRNLNKV